MMAMAGHCERDYDNRARQLQRLKSEALKMSMEEIQHTNGTSAVNIDTSGSGGIDKQQ